MNFHEILGKDLRIKSNELDFRFDICVYIQALVFCEMQIIRNLFHFVYGRSAIVEFCILVSAFWFAGDIVCCSLFRLKIDRRSTSARRASQNRQHCLAQAGANVYKLRRKLAASTVTVNRRLSFRTSVPGL